MFKIEKRIVKTNQDIISKQCMRNGDGVLAVTKKDRKTA